MEKIILERIENWKHHLVNIFSRKVCKIPHLIYNGLRRVVVFLLFYYFLAQGKTFQNLSVSSPAPVTIVSPEGFIAKKRTLLVCPVKVVTFYKLGYFQTII